jgi:hypothetical protein
MHAMDTDHLRSLFALRFEFLAHYPVSSAGFHF